MIALLIEIISALQQSILRIITDQARVITISSHLAIKAAQGKSRVSQPPWLLWRKLSTWMMNSSYSMTPCQLCNKSRPNPSRQSHSIRVRSCSAIDHWVSTISTEPARMPTTMTRRWLRSLWANTQTEGTNWAIAVALCPPQMRSVMLLPTL